MASVTSNLNLVKPSLGDSANIENINPNWDKLDEEVFKKLEIGNIIQGDNITIEKNESTKNITISAKVGNDGREIQLQTTPSTIQWKYNTDTLWTDLVALSDLKGANGLDGFSPIATVSKSDGVATISITDNNGTTITTVTDGVNGVDGQDGQDGFSPVATVSKVGSVATITITDKTGTTTTTISDGINGSGEGGTTDYSQLTNKPTINNIELSGNKTSTDLGLASADHNHDTSYANISHTHNDKLDVSLKGVSNGIAELDANGKVLATQLPSYVDDVLEGTLSTFPSIGETGKIYIDTDTNKTYRWSGSTYVVISDTITLGETSSTAYRGDRGKLAYDHLQTTHAPSDAQKNSDITKAEIEAKLTGEISTHTHSTTEIDNKIGVLNGLTTTVKTDLVSAINENVTNMGLKLAKTDVVNTTTQVETDGKALNAVQANPNVDGTLAKQINDLNGNVKLKSYTTNSVSDIPTVIKSMDGNSILSGVYTGAILGISGSFTVFINKQNQDRCSVFATLTGTNIAFIGDYRTTNGIMNWAQIATTDYLTANQVKMFLSTIPSDVTSNASYQTAYVGTVINDSGMPNTGQWRLQYIPYFSYTEGYSVQMAYGCVGNSTIWYRKSQGKVWQSWIQIATTETLDITSYVVDGWTLQWGELKAFRSGNLVTIQCQLQNASTGALNIFSGLPASIRPTAQRMCNVQSGRVSTSNKTFYDVIIDTNGLIRIGSATPYSTANAYLNLLITYAL